MNQTYVIPNYLSISKISKKFGRDASDIEADFISGKFNRFQLLNQHKNYPATRSRITKLMDRLNIYAREHLHENPDHLLVLPRAMQVNLTSSQKKKLKDNINSDLIFEMWLKEYELNIDYMKLVIPSDEVIKYAKSLVSGHCSFVAV